MKTQQELAAIAGKFAIKGNIKEVKPLGNGLINDTFKVSADGPEDYVLQRINNAIFQDVELLQHNIEAVTRHIRAKLEAAGEADLDRKVLRFVSLKDSPKTYWTDGETYWRISVFIPDALTFEAVTPEYSYYAGKAFGRFEAQLADIPDTLGETIPDFHNMELRARQLREAVAADKAGRMSDPEVKNMMFDKDGNVLCVIDLDTVMPSFVFSDFGDFLRTAANFVAEDDPDTAKVGFNMEIFKAFSKGYLESASSFLTPVEKENLPYAACLFPYMQCVRFFADYINGDTYYKIKYPTHNMDRTRNQWALFKSALAKVPEMKAWIESL